MKKKQELPVLAISLGCPKNRVDTEKLLGSSGFSVRLAANFGQAKLVFINTCAFIEPAVKESIRTILDAIKKTERLKRKPLLAVAGCLPGRYDLKELQKELPEVDIWLVPEQQKDWPALLQNKLNLQSEKLQEKRLVTTSSYAWLKISDGCNHGCSFCTIPSIRGKFRSEPLEKLLLEAEFLTDKGIKELVLVGQDTGAWGRDFCCNAMHLPYLLEKLALLPKLIWLRLLYMYPSSITDELLKMMAETGMPLLPYLDIPFQHSSTAILKSMGRPFNKNPWQVIEKVRKFLPDAALRTSIIVGYPEETDADFMELCKFVKEAKFHNLGVFVYYPEDGTAAAAISNQIPDKIKEYRREELMKIQADISAELLRGYVGKRMDVLVDENKDHEWPGLFQGRVWFQAPEIDGITYISGENLAVGSMQKAEIADSQVYDLSALV